MDDFIKWFSIGFRHTAMYLDKKLAHYGLNNSQYMYVVRVCESPGVTQDQFLQMFYIHPSNVTRAVASLEKQGFIQRRANRQDRRTFCLFPTSRALEVYPHIVKMRQEWQEELLGQVEPALREPLRQAMEKIALHAVEKTKQEE